MTHINSTIIDFYITPYNDWYLEIPKFNISLLNFTWEVTNFTKDELKLKLEFNDPVIISPHTV